MTKNTYTRRKVTTQSTWKKSQASIVEACVRMNCRQVDRLRCGAGATPASTGTTTGFSTIRGSSSPTGLTGLLNFLAHMAHPLVQPGTDQAARLVAALNTLLAPDGWELRTGGFISGQPVYSASGQSRRGSSPGTLTPATAKACDTVSNSSAV